MLPNEKMSFEKELEFIRLKLALDLPGERAQYLMAPKERETSEIYIKKSPNHRKSSVMMLLFPDAFNRATTVFIERPINNSIHSGQIAFPGGKEDPTDTSLQHTAIRETEEEIGIPTSDIEIIGKLTSLFIPASNFLVQPYVGLISSTPVFVPNEYEVRSVIPFSIRELLKLQPLTKDFKTSYGNLKAPYFLIEGHSVWGATAMMLSEFRELIK